jgi:hypothetical protein
MYVAQDRDKRQALEKKIINLLDPKILINSSNLRLLDSQEELSSLHILVSWLLITTKIKLDRQLLV